MRDYAVRVGQGRFGEKLGVRSRDELGELALELSRMSQRLASLDAERRAFLASVAHELRTPVSNLQVTLEALAGAEEEPELRARFTRAAGAELQRLAKLIQDLLKQASPKIEALAKAEGVNIIVDREAVVWADKSVDLTAKLNAEMK